ncbi:MAG: hypothetical protein HC906_08550 [Bacteroidales bacterium]|nr:hypothetical protein [Bacteroidales bacterium]
MKKTLQISKLLFFLIFFTIVLKSCSKEEADIVPDTYLNVSINIINYPIGIGQSIELDNIQAGVPNLGYDNNGIIIYRDDQNSFLAFDRTCTYHIDESISVNVTDGIFAVCPLCNSLYQLYFSGYPTEEGPATHPLKQYKTEFNPNTMDLFIFNY